MGGSLIIIQFENYHCLLNCWAGVISSKTNEAFSLCLCDRWFVCVLTASSKCIIKKTRQLHSGSLAPSSHFLTPAPIFPLPQSQCWKITLLDACATPDDPLSPHCSARGQASCLVLRSKQSLTFYSSSFCCVCFFVFFIVFNCSVSSSHFSNLSWHCLINPATTLSLL